MGNIAQMIDENAWRRALKPGDEAAVKSGHWYGAKPYELHKVARVLKTQIVLDNGARFSIDNGYQVGGPSHSRSRLFPVTPEVRDECEAYAICDWLCRLARDIERNKAARPALETLRAMKAAYETAELERDGDHDQGAQ